MSDPTHASTTDDAHDAHAHAPPGLPEIRDEAVEAPSWLPALAIGLLIAFIAGTVLTSKLTAPDEEARDEAAPDEQAQPADEAPEAPPAQPE